MTMDLKETNPRFFPRSDSSGFTNSVFMVTLQTTSTANKRIEYIYSGLYIHTQLHGELIEFHSILMRGNIYKNQYTSSASPHKLTRWEVEHKDSGTHTR